VCGRFSFILVLALILQVCFLLVLAVSFGWVVSLLVFKCGKRL